MAGGLFARVKTWIKGETIHSEDLNLEFDNIIQNLVPDKIDDWSATVTQMRLQTDPGSQGSESQATSLAGEIQRLRYVISRIVGFAYWYDNPNTSLATLSSSIAGVLVLPKTRIESGRVDANGQPMFLVPNGSGSVRLEGAPTNLRGYINNVAFTLAADLTLSGLTGPASFTTLVNDAALAGGAATKLLGENGTSIPVDTPTGTAPTVGSFQAWKVGAEYFYGQYKSATEIAKCRRGHLFDASDAWIPRVGISNNDTITLMRAAYVFYSTDLAGLYSTYNKPTVSFDQPSVGLTLGDFWFDISAGIWKRYNGSSFVDVNAVLVGIAVIDGTNAVVGCRSVDFVKAFSQLNTALLEKLSSTVVQATEQGSKVNVYGSNVEFPLELPSWVMPTDLDSGLSEASNTTYYLYLTPSGDEVISDVAPYDRSFDLLGFYHPSKPWRSIGTVLNDGSSNFGDPANQDLVITARIKDASITSVKMGASNRAESASSGAFATTSGSYVDVTNLSVSLTVSGLRPVELKILPDNSGSSTGVQSSSNALAGIRFTRNGSGFGEIEFRGTGPTNLTVPITAFHGEDSPSAGTHTYKVQAVNFGGGTTSVLFGKLVAREV